jgi:hypothetical protein
VDHVLPDSSPFLPPSYQFLRCHWRIFFLIFFFSPPPSPWYQPLLLRKFKWRDLDLSCLASYLQPIRANHHSLLNGRVSTSKSSQRVMLYAAASQEQAVQHPGWLSGELRLPITSIFPLSRCFLSPNIR